MAGDVISRGKGREKAFEKRPSFRRKTMIIGTADFESKPWLYAIIITICILGLHKEKGQPLSTFAKATQGKNPLSCMFVSLLRKTLCFVNALFKNALK